MPLNPQFDPYDFDPSLIVNRDAERQQLTASIGAWLDAAFDNRARGRTWPVIGEKGVGKSILTRAVLRKLRERRSSSTLFVAIDCRRARSWREILSALAAGLVHEIDDLEAVGASLPPGVLDAARVANTLAGLDSVTQSQTHERLLQFQTATRLGGVFQRLLKAEFDISLERSQRDIRSLVGLVTIDEHRISRLLVALLRDLRDAGLPSVIYLDNVDELDHDYHDEQAIKHVRAEVDGLLSLKDAPVALVVNMRTYFAGALPREVSPAIILDPLPPDVLLEVLAKRIELEAPAVQDAMRSTRTSAALRRLSSTTPTPLAFLDAVRYLVENDGLSEDQLVDGLWHYTRSRFASVDPSDIEALLPAFEQPGATIPRAQLLAAVGGDELVLAQLESTQAVLPTDFWSPSRFSLDPLLHTVHQHRGTN